MSPVWLECGQELSYFVAMLGATDHDTREASAMSDLQQRPDRPAGVPEPYGSVSPWVITRDTGRLIEFATAAFGASELGRMTDESGVVGHAEFRIGDTIVLAFDARPQWPDTPAFLRIYVEDGDATFARAIEAGAEEITRMTPLFWGDRVGRVRDPLGNIWWIQQHDEEVDEAEMGRRLADPVWQERMAYVTSMDPFADRALIGP
jgi:PhnB protein